MLIFFKFETTKLKAVLIYKMEKTIEIVLAIFLSITLVLIGFKIINPFKKDKSSEHEIWWYKKHGIFYKVGGILLFVFMIVLLVLRLLED